MLTPQVRSQFVTKILTSQNGDTYRVVFLVSMVDGAPRGQVISAELISTKTSEQTAPTVAPLCLTEASQSSPKTFAYKPSFSGIVSPISFLDFFMSQPTRAPSL